MTTAHARVLAGAAALALLAGCSGGQDEQAAPTSSTSISTTATTTAGPDPADLFEQEMVARDLTPRLGQTIELQMDAVSLCEAYANGTQLQEAADLATAGFDTQDLISFAEAATKVYCPQFSA